MRSDAVVPKGICRLSDATAKKQGVTSALINYGRNVLTLGPAAVRRWGVVDGD